MKLEPPTRPGRLLRTAALLAAVCATGAVRADATQASAGASLGQIRISYETLDSSVTPYPWIWVVTFQDWVPMTSSVSASLADPTLGQQYTGWLTQALQAAVASGAASAGAVLGSGNLVDADGSASASVTVGSGLLGAASAQLFDGRILLSARSRLTITASLGSLWAQGGDGSAQATATLQMAGMDGSNVSTAEAWAFDSPSFNDVYAPSTLSVQWSNTSSDAAYARVWIGVGAQAESALAAVPEAPVAAMLALGLATLGLLLRGQARRAA